MITGAGRLPSRYVIHTVGPVWNGGNNNEAEELSQCYYNALSIAIKHDCRSIAFPNISTGIYHFPKALAASIAVRTVTEYLDNEAQVITVRFVCFDAENFELVNAELNKRGIK